MRALRKERDWLRNTRMRCLFNLLNFLGYNGKTPDPKTQKKNAAEELDHIEIDAKDLKIFSNLVHGTKNKKASKKFEKRKIQKFCSVRRIPNR